MGNTKASGAAGDLEVAATNRFRPHQGGRQGPPRQEARQAGLEHEV